MTQQHADAQAEFEAASREHEGLSDEILLRRYLADRASSADYDQYKGLVALAYRDLEDLSGYLISAANESAQALRRIVLYIDDLDRCAPDTVADIDVIESGLPPNQTFSVRRREQLRELGQQVDGNN